MIKKTGVLIVLLICLLASCNEESRNTSRVPVPAKEDPEVTEDVVEAVENSSDLLQDLSAERNIETLLCQGWVMDDDTAVIVNTDEAEGMEPYRCFYLHKDHTYTKNVRNYLEHGHWLYNDEKKTFSLVGSGGSTDQYKIAAIGPEELVVINAGINSVTLLKFAGSGRSYKNKNDDPYYVDNNLWRIKPRVAETDEQIRRRLKECIRFYILFYKDNLERKDKVISFYGFPTCLKWYGGGIFMIRESELADNWFACFYNKEQALKAYRMMKEVIMKKYNWSKGNSSWVKINLVMLEKMYDNI